MFDEEQSIKLENIRKEEGKRRIKPSGTALGIDFQEGITHKDLDEEQSIYEKDQKRIDRKYNSKKFPNFRLTGEYLIRKYLDREFQLDKKKIIKDLHITIDSLNGYLSELNRYERFQPMRWISVSGKKDWIEVAGSDFRNSTKWIKKNFKGLVSRTTRVFQTKEKVRMRISI